MFLAHAVFALIWLNPMALCAAPTSFVDAAYRRPPAEILQVCGQRQSCRAAAERLRC